MSPFARDPTGSGGGGDSSDDTDTTDDGGTAPDTDPATDPSFDDPTGIAPSPDDGGSGTTDGGDGGGDTGTGDDYDPVQGPGIGTDPTPDDDGGAGGGTTGPDTDPATDPSFDDPTGIAPSPGDGGGGVSDYDPVQGPGIGTQPGNGGDPSGGGGMPTGGRTQPGASAGGTPGDVIGTSVEESGLNYGPIGATSSQLQRQARQFERSLVANRPDLDADEVDINITRVDGEYQFFPEFTEGYQRERAAGMFDRLFGDEAPTGRAMTPREKAVDQSGAFEPESLDIMADEVVLGDDGATLGETAQREVAAERFSDRVGVPIGTGDVRIEDGQATLTDPARERVAAEQVQTRTGQQAVTATLLAGASAGGVNLDRDFVSTVVSGFDEDTLRSFGLQQGEDFTVDAGGDGVAVETTEQFREDIVRQQLGVETDLTAEETGGERGYSFAIDEGEDYVVTDDGGIQLTPEGRRAIITSRLLEQGYIETGQATAEVAGRTLGAGDTTRTTIRSASQLQFNEQGELVGISPADKTGLAGGVQGVAQLGGAINEQFIQPAAVLSGDIQEAYSQTLDIANPFDDESATEAAAGAARSAVDVVRGEDEEISQGTFAETGTAKVGGGAGGLLTVPFQLPQLGYTVGKTSIEAAEFTGEQIAEEGVVSGGADVLAAGGGAAVEYGEQQAISAINNPFRTAGGLAGSLVVLGGAAAISRGAASGTFASRAGLGARLAIQPGEEALGYGGAALFRRAPGSTTTAIGQRAFPNNEPLLFSEEAAIRAGKRVSGGLQNTLGRVRQRAGPAARSAVQGAMSPGRLGTGLGGLEFETDTDTDVITAEDLDVQQEPVRPAEERTEIDAADPIQRRRERARQAEEPTFSTETPTTMMERRAARQEAARITGMEPGEMQFDDPTMSVQERVRAARESDVLVDETFDPTAETSRRVETAQQAQTDQDLLTEGLTDQSLDQRLDARSVVDLRGETDTRTDTDVRVDLDTELETRQETDTEQEQRLFVESETEAEAETETELELENAFEVESETKDKKQQQDGSGDLSLGSAVETFTYGVADPSDVISGGILNDETATK